MAKLTPPPGPQDHARGKEGAPVTLVEYGDFQCPHCGKAFPAVEDIVKKMGPGLRFIFRHFPLSESHAMAKPAAIAAEAAGRQGKFWEMHHGIFQNQAMLSVEALFAIAQHIGLDLEQFRNDIQDTALEDKVDADFESGVRSGVNGTPSFFINGHKYNGSYDEESLMASLTF
ncbi:DsbA family protein [Chitinophaga caseinilytica]|uniref:Thioredoxin domain-containing protein n=1 Tax=Chitinophaga caseinilytica TaxID=2267521 RepID=A0ABZ2Z9F4_9BACT